VFGLPDKGDAPSDLQSIVFREYWEILSDGISGKNCVLSGLAVTGGADMTPAVAKGAVISNGVLFAIAAADVTITAAHATLDRIDLIVVTSAGALAVRAGTAAAAPKPPVRTANDVVIAHVHVPATDTAIATAQITDMRVMREQGPIVLKKTTTPVVVNTNATLQNYFTITLPSGLLLAGRTLRVRCGGTYLLNSGTPTMTLRIQYGGTTMFQDVSIAGAADADRGAWHLEFDVVAQANNDQALNGFITYQNTVAAGRVAAATGVGEMLGSVAVAGRPVTSPINGAAAVDSDTADRTLTVDWTMSVSNVADEIAMEFATAELL